MMKPILKFAEPVMGTVASVHVVADRVHSQVVTAVGRVFGELHRLEALFSTFIKTSEISRINSGELSLLDASPEVIEVMDACTWLEHVSDGAFVARRPNGGLDPAGFVKGWAGQRASKYLAEFGLDNWLINIGGDIQTAGLNADNQPWSVGISNPHSSDELRFSLDVIDQAVATSGTGARGLHLWDVKGGPIEALGSMTVVGPELRLADAFATAAYVKGLDGVAWVEQFPGYHALAITLSGDLLAPAWAVSSI